MSDSLFFNYFKDKLRFFLLWKENAWWPVIRGIAHSLDQVRDDIKWVRDQYSPATCDDEFIELFGESRGIIRFPFEEKAQFSQRVNEAYDYWKSAGITSTIQAWINKLGIAATIIEYKDKGTEDYLAHLDWAEIYVQFDSFYVSSEQKEYIQLLINDLKRASALIMAGFRLQSVHDTSIELTRHLLVKRNNIWQYCPDLMVSNFRTIIKRRPIIHVPKSLPSMTATATLDDTITHNSTDFVRTFDSGWFFDLPEDRPVKVRKAI